MAGMAIEKRRKRGKCTEGEKADSLLRLLQQAYEMRVVLLNKYFSCARKTKIGTAEGMYNIHIIWWM